MKCNLPNRKSGNETPEEEAEFRQSMGDSIAKIMKVMLRLLKPLVGDLPDYRDQRRVTYPKESLFLYGVMMFAMLAETRREANRFMTEPFMQANLKAVIPGLDAVAHNDTLMKFLLRIGAIGAEVIQKIYHALIKKLLRNKEFRRLAGNLTILVDGSGKGSKDWKYSDKALHRKTTNGKVWMTYVLHSVLVLENGMVIPLCTEFLENDGGEFDKQDCETKAWSRMAPKLHKLVGDGATVILDGLYASGPIITQCMQYAWEYIITLKDGSMPSVADEAHRLMKYNRSDSVATELDGRQQVIEWANDVEFMVSQNRTYIGLHIVRMEESWTEFHTATGKNPEQKKATYQWISSRPLNERNAQGICMLGRKRWLVENNFKTEKHDGYGFGHYFSLDWDVNKAYHYFMNIGHFVNVMILSSELFDGLVLSLGGIGAFLKKVRLVFSGFVLDAKRILAATEQPFRWRFSTLSIYSQIASPP